MKVNYIIIPLATTMVSVAGRYFTDIGFRKWHRELKLSYKPKARTFFVVGIWVFAFATLGALMVWNSKMTSSDDQLLMSILFLINGGMNVFWSFLFFQIRLTNYAFFVAASSAVSVLSLILYIYSILPFAAILLLPYLFWVCLSAYITYTVWI